MSNFYTGVTILTVLGMIVMSFVVYANYSMPRRKKIRFVIAYAMISLGAILEWGAMMLETVNSSIALHTVVKAMELILAPSIPLAIMMALALDRKMLAPMVAVVSINTVLVIYSCFSGLVFYVDSSNVYHHGDLYMAYNLSFIIGIIFLIISTVNLVKVYQSRSTKLLAFILVYLVVGLSMHMIDRTVWVNYLTITIDAILLYIVNEDVIRSSDSLTKLLNRHSYDSLIDNVDNEALIINIDVDFFKQCNDTYGHSFGDKVLVEVGSLIRTCLGRHGRCFRTGGDEFCVVIQSSVSDPELLLELLHQKMAEKREEMDRLPFVSTGYAIFDPKTESIHDAIDRADTMMYMFKNLRKKLMAEGKNPTYMEIQTILRERPLKTLKNIRKK